MSLDGVVVHSIAAPVGEFACSNELLNRIRTLVRWAQRSNMMSILTDCPHREKLGWLEQDHLDGPSLRYEFDLARLFAKSMNDMAEAQTDDGLVPNIAPEYTKFNGVFRAATEWGSAFIIVPWQQYQFAGDVDLLKKHYAAMKRYFAYVERNATNDIATAGLGDWNDLGPQKPGPAQLTPAPVTATAFYYRDAWILSQIADILGHADEAKDFAARAARIRASYNRHFFSRDKSSYAAGSQCANALPLVFDIVEPQNRDAVMVSLVRDVESGGYAVTAGDVGFRFLLEALTLGGHADVVYRLINQDETPGYAYQLKRGETSLTESWDANHFSSHNHFMLGQIVEWFYKDLVGIGCDPAGAGFKKIVVHPHPVGDVTWAEATYRSIHGPIAVRWERDGKRFRLKTMIPANASAIVFLPASDRATVMEGGAPVERSPGVTFLRHEGDRAVFHIESGSYDFESQW
ncbi:MAG TPA: alpha-L-rhamnosidase C-terminal domain-containing protein [Vicinamibacterales bacterium]|nr:alpha-L-rhamnosidase C-terminal domain-containing protein [Vicinamibacterales bacterium]